MILALLLALTTGGPPIVAPDAAQAPIRASLDLLDRRGYGRDANGLIVRIVYDPAVPWAGAACPDGTVLLGSYALLVDDHYRAGIILHEATHLAQMQAGWAYDPVWSEGQADAVQRLFDPRYPWRAQAEIWPGWNEIPCPETQALAPLVRR